MDYIDFFNALIDQGAISDKEIAFIRAQFDKTKENPDDFDISEVDRIADLMQRCPKLNNRER